MQDNDPKVVSIASAKKHQEASGGGYVQANMWLCECGSAFFVFSKEWGLVCKECDNPQEGYLGNL